MGCASCAKKNSATKRVVSDNRAKETVATIAGKTEEGKALVHIRYYGGGSKKAVGTGCSTCRGKKGGYVVTTSETIQFVSEDAPNGLYKGTFSIGHDYYVTEKQAEYLLALTYTNRAGQVVHKFKKAE